PASTDVRAIEVKPEDTLGFFSTAANMPAPRDPSLCADVRELRRNPNHSDRLVLLDRIKRSNVFSLASLRTLRQRLRFEALFGGFVQVTVNGTRYQTG